MNTARVTLKSHTQIVPEKTEDSGFDECSAMQGFP